jgi:Immunity protein Imm1
MGVTVRFAVPATMGPLAAGRRAVCSATEVEELVDAIAELPGRSVVIHHAGRPVTGNVFFDDRADVYDHELVAAVHAGWGYLRMWAVDDGDDSWILAGDPASPTFVSDESEFPSGTGVALPGVVAALREFLETARRPLCVDWVAEQVD